MVNEAEQVSQTDLHSIHWSEDVHSRLNRKLTAVILAGGQASRYGGTAKGLIEFAPGMTIIARMIEEIRWGEPTEIAISANNPDPYEAFGLPILADLRAGLGPIGGIEAGLSHFRDVCNGVLFLPCDLPSISRNEISALICAFDESGAEVVFARDGSFFDHPLCSVVHSAALPAVSKLIDEGCRRIADLWASLGATSIQFECDAPFFNVNTPADIARWKGK